jgi:dihydroxy-acid dehydratase
MSDPINKFSRRITQPKSQGASQAQLYATGLTEADLDKAQVGIASVWYEGNSCNMHLNDLAAVVKQGVVDAGLVGMRFNTIGVSDGMSMGTTGMRYSLQSRDLIADSIETVMGAQWYDAAITIPGCDKNMPGCIMGMARINRPSLMVYGGTIKPGKDKGGCPLDIVSAFQSYGEYIAERIDEDQRQDIVRHACPGAGACGGMYTANTMASAIEAMGMSLPFSSSVPAEDGGKRDECLRAGAAVRLLLERDIKPRDIMTREAFENAMVLTMALGGSTNAVLHLVAMARAAGRSARGGRHPRRAEAAARPRRDPRRLPHCDGPDPGGEPRGSPAALRRSAGDPRLGCTHQGDGAHPDPARQSRAGGSGREDHRQGRALLLRCGQALRRRRGDARGPREG